MTRVVHFSFFSLAVSSHPMQMVLASASTKHQHAIVTHAGGLNGLVSVLSSCVNDTWRLQGGYRQDAAGVCALQVRNAQTSVYQPFFSPVDVVALVPWPP